MKKSLVLVAVASLVAACGLQADYRNSRMHSERRGTACDFTLVNDSGADIIAKDVHNNEVFNIPVGGSAKFSPSRRHHTPGSHWSHHRVVNIYVKQKDGSSPLTYKLFEKRCSLNEEPSQLTMTKVKEYIKYYNPRFRTYEVGNRCERGCRSNHVHRYHKSYRDNQEMMDEDMQGAEAV